MQKLWTNSKETANSVIDRYIRRPPADLPGELENRDVATAPGARSRTSTVDSSPRVGSSPRTLQAITQLKGHSDSVQCVTYSPDGKQLASAGYDKAIFLWAKQSSSCLPGSQENWQLIRRFEMNSRLFAEGAFLKGAKISESNLELLKQKSANDDQDLPEHSHFSS